MKRIGGADPSGQRQTGQECLCDGDLIGFFGHSHLEERFLALMGAEREQVGSRLLICSGSAHGFAIQSNWVIRTGYQRAAYPVSQGAFDLLGIQAGEEFAVQGIGRAQEAARSKQPFKQSVLVTTPLRNGQRRVCEAVQTCDHAGEQIGQLIA